MQIRIATPDDAATVAAIYAPYVEETVISFEDVAPDAAEIAHRIGAYGATHPFLVGVDGGIVGYAYAGPHRARPAYRWAVETSVFLDRDARGKGYGRALYGVLLETLHSLRYTTAWAGVTLPNAPSEGLHAALGFTPVGVYTAVGYKNGAWHDVGWFRRALHPPTDPPEEPLPWEGVISPAPPPRTDGPTRSRE